MENGLDLANFELQSGKCVISLYKKLTLPSPSPYSAGAIALSFSGPAISIPSGLTLMGGRVDVADNLMYAVIESWHMQQLR